MGEGGEGGDEIRGKSIDGGPEAQPPPVNVVRVQENGPLAVHADLAIEGHPPALRATLCRCGASKNKPYCDGSHVAAKFEATGEPAPARGGGPGLTEHGGKLEVTLIPDGPLLVRGNLEVVTAAGHTLWRSDRTALCRCGGSGKKPFCDGTHNSIRFKTE